MYPSKTSPWRIFRCLGITVRVTAIRASVHLHLYREKIENSIFAPKIGNMCFPFTLAGYRHFSPCLTLINNSGQCGWFAQSRILAWLDARMLRADQFRLKKLRQAARLENKIFCKFLVFVIHLPAVPNHVHFCSSLTSLMFYFQEIAIQFWVFLWKMTYYSNNRALFCVYIASSRHEEGWENSRLV